MRVHSWPSWPHDGRRSQSACDVNQVLTSRLVPHTTSFTADGVTHSGTPTPSQPATPCMRLQASERAPTPRGSSADRPSRSRPLCYDDGTRVDEMLQRCRRFSRAVLIACRGRRELDARDASTTAAAMLLLLMMANMLAPQVYIMVPMKLLMGSARAAASRALFQRAHVHILVSQEVRARGQDRAC